MHQCNNKLPKLAILGHPQMTIFWGRPKIAPNFGKCVSNFIDNKTTNNNRHLGENMSVLVENTTNIQACQTVI